MKCPVCSKETFWEGNQDRPFCSERCKLVDLGAWAAEEYRIACNPLAALNNDRHLDSEDYK